MVQMPAPHPCSAAALVALRPKICHAVPAAPTPRVLPPAPSTPQAQDLLYLPQESQHFLGLMPTRWSLQAHFTLCKVKCSAKKS